MTAVALKIDPLPFYVDAIEAGERLRNGAAGAFIGSALELSTQGLESYFFAEWDPVLIDLLVVAAAADFCDSVRHRPEFSWSRFFDVRVAVHDEERWNQKKVRATLAETLGFLTGDVWRFSFVTRLHEVSRVSQNNLKLPSTVKTVVPYSDGLDSRAVCAILAAAEGKSSLVRVRLGSRGVDQPRRLQKQLPFAIVPYRVRSPQRAESSARSRGFKFAVVTGIAALLAGVQRIIVTESGQGAFGPLLAVSGQAYPDYRVHPSFSRRMENLFFALTGKSIRYEYPRLWSTKAETLREAAGLDTTSNWANTWSCWQQARQSSVDRRRRQCGICAACMLRRMSMFAAGIDEPPETYIWERLSAENLEAGAASGFLGITRAMRNYALAGVLHLDHLADFVESPVHARALRRVARDTAEALDMDSVSAENRLCSLLARHAEEWRAFQRALGAGSFVAKLASARP